MNTIKNLEDIKGFKWVLDMDDTLANFHDKENALERFAVEKFFFMFLEPTNLLNEVKKAIASGIVTPEDVYILSASPHYLADYSKLIWLREHLPEIKESNVVFTRLGENKADIFKSEYGLTNEDLSHYVLIDDYTTNLINWKKSNGIAIKYINHFNNTKGNYKALSIPYLQLN